MAGVILVGCATDLRGQVEAGTRLRVTYRCKTSLSIAADGSCRETGESLAGGVDPLRWRSDRGEVAATPLSALIQLERRRPGLSTPEVILVVYLATAVGSLSGGALGCLVGPKSQEDGCLVGATVGFLAGAGLGFHEGRAFASSRRAAWVPVVLPGRGVGLSLGYAIRLRVWTGPSR
jgi:hypothetical protein